MENKVIDRRRKDTGAAPAAAAAHGGTASPDPVSRVNPRSGQAQALTRAPAARGDGEVSGEPLGRDADGGAVSGARKQTELFEKAIAFFHSGEYGKAKSLFLEASRGSLLELAHAARLHASMCERRLSHSEPVLKTVEDRYNYAITLINERRIETAERHLLQAVLQLPEGDHIYYALALCRGLSGDLDGAYRNLKKALELQPRNRALARNDPDFAEIGQRSPLRELLYP